MEENNDPMGNLVKQHSDIIQKKYQDTYDFYEVKKVDNWGSWYEWNGKVIEAGCYWIRWPDGKETQENVHPLSIPFSYGDMGHTYESSNTTAYIEKEVNGVKARVDILGLFIKPIKESKCD